MPDFFCSTFRAVCLSVCRDAGHVREARPLLSQLRSRAGNSCLPPPTPHTALHLQTHGPVSPSTFTQTSSSSPSVALTWPLRLTAWLKPGNKQLFACFLPSFLIPFSLSVCLSFFQSFRLVLCFCEFPGLPFLCVYLSVFLCFVFLSLSLSLFFFLPPKGDWGYLVFTALSGIPGLSLDPPFTTCSLLVLCSPFSLSSCSVWSFFSLLFCLVLFLSLVLLFSPFSLSCCSV